MSFFSLADGGPTVLSEMEQLLTTPEVRLQHHLEQRQLLHRRHAGRPGRLQSARSQNGGGRLLKLLQNASRRKLVY